MSRRTVTADGAPKALGPYAQAVDAGTLVFCSGQVGLDPATSRLVEGGIEAETARALSDSPSSLRSISRMRRSAFMGARGLYNSAQRRPPSYNPRAHG